MTADTLQHWSWLDELEEGIVLVEAGRVSYLNRAAAELLEVAPTQAMNQPIIAVFRDHRLERAYEMGEAVELETRGRRLLAKPVSGGMSLQDLSRLRQAQESARELLAVLSHELRTPATTVRATLEALRMELPAAEREHFLRQAEAEVERLIRLLEDLTVDVKPPNMRRILLTDVAERAQALLQDTLDSRGIDLVVSLPPLTVWADSDKLLQVLINLLENAALHGPEHKTVWLSAQPDPEDASFIRVSVRDQGKPLRREVVGQLFEPHTRGSPGAAKGSGLGLSIVRSIVERWGGHAWGRPLEDGNEFGFSVPMKDERMPLSRSFRPGVS